jgi:hypothetical protein
MFQAPSRSEGKTDCLSDTIAGLQRLMCGNDIRSYDITLFVASITLSVQAALTR